MAKKAIFFDVDDTLLDNFNAFKKTVADLLPSKKLSSEIFKEMYVAFRLQSERIYEESLAVGQGDSRPEFDRWRTVFSYFELDYAEEDLLKFDEVYHLYQSRGELSLEYQTLFKEMEEKQILVGIFTNGFAEAQKNKIAQLKLNEFIPEEYIFISDLFGDAKPNVSCFEKLKNMLPNEVAEIFYVGDSYKNDIVPSYHAGWQPIWLNRFNENQTDYHSYQVIDFHELREVIEKLA